MKILYVSQYFPPEMGAPSARVSEMSKYWAEKGHDVTVLTGFPNHPTGKIFPEYRDKIKRKICIEEVNGCRVVRTWLLTIPNGRPFERILNYTSFFASATLTGLRMNDFDVVIATSPQLLCGFAGYLIGRMKGKPFVLEIRDLWPESLVGSGIGSEDSMMIKMIDRLANFLYERSSHIVVVTEKFREDLISKRNISGNKITVIENGMETELFKPLKVKDEVNEKIGDKKDFIVSYIGTHGFAHGLEIVLNTANSLKDRNDIKFLLIGEGARKDYLKEKAIEMNLQNVQFVDYQPRELIPQFINASDACMVLLKNSEVFKTVLPTKMLEFMSCETPVILGVDGLAREVVGKADAGISITPEDSDELARAIIKLKENPELRKKMGENGRQFILQNYTRRQKAHQYLTLLESI